MANNRFNKQVTPKGYKVGGRVSKMGGGMSLLEKTWSLVTTKMTWV